MERLRTAAASMRRRRFRLMLVSASALAALALGGCVSTRTQDGISGTCTQPSTLNDGFFLGRSVYFRVSTQPDPLDPKTTWICYRVKTPNQPETAGRIDVNPTTTVSRPPAVTTDLDSRACATGTGNIETPHPIESGELLGTPFYVDAFATMANGDGNAWLCIEVGSFKQRVMVQTPQLNDPDVTVSTDPAPPPITDTTPPPTGKASSTCAAGAYGPAAEQINAHENGHDLFLYTARQAFDELHICARISGTPSGGGHLGVKAAANQVVDVQQSSDLTPCTQSIVVTATPQLSIKTSPIGQGAPSICVNGTRYTVVTGPLPPVVTFTPDT